MWKCQNKPQGNFSSVVPVAKVLKMLSEIHQAKVSPLRPKAAWPDNKPGGLVKGPAAVLAGLITDIFNTSLNSPCALMIQGRHHCPGAEYINRNLPPREPAAGADFCHNGTVWVTHRGSH